jgi:hypothetical protein
MAATDLEMRDDAGEMVPIQIAAGKMNWLQEAVRRVDRNQLRSIACRPVAKHEARRRVAICLPIWLAPRSARTSSQRRERQQSWQPPWSS